MSYRDFAPRSLLGNTGAREERCVSKTDKIPRSSFAFLTKKAWWGTGARTHIKIVAALLLGIAIHAVLWALLEYWDLNLYVTVSILLIAVRNDVTVGDGAIEVVGAGSSVEVGVSSVLELSGTVEDALDVVDDSYA